jgi:hypothetical protein
LVRRSQRRLALERADQNWNIDIERWACARELIEGRRAALVWLRH